MTDQHSTGDGHRAPDFWAETAGSDAPASRPAPPVDAGQPRRPKQSGRGWIIASLILSALSVVGAVVLPHFMAVLAIIAAGCAWNGIRLSKGTGTPKLGVGALITSVVVFIGCVIYTIVIVQLGFAYWENLQ